MRECVARCCGNTHLLNRRQVERAKLARQRLTSILALIFRIPESEGDRVCLMDQRCPAFEFGEQHGAVPRDQREIHGCRLPIGIGFGLKEIRLPVYEQQPVAASSAQRQCGTHDDRAVPAQHHRKLTFIQERLDGIRQLGGIGCDGACIENMRLGVALLASRRTRLDSSCMSAVQALENPCFNSAVGSCSTPFDRKPNVEGASSTA